MTVVALAPRAHAASAAPADLGRVVFKWTAPDSGRTVTQVAAELGIGASAAWTALGAYLSTRRGRQAATAEQVTTPAGGAA